MDQLVLALKALWEIHSPEVSAYQKSAPQAILVKNLKSVWEESARKGVKMLFVELGLLAIRIPTSACACHSTLEIPT